MTTFFVDLAGVMAVTALIVLVCIALTTCFVLAFEFAAARVEHAHRAKVLDASRMLARCQRCRLPITYSRVEGWTHLTPRLATHLDGPHEATPEGDGA